MHKLRRKIGMGARAKVVKASTVLMNLDEIKGAPNGVLHVLQAGEAARCVRGHNQ